MPIAVHAVRIAWCVGIDVLLDAAVEAVVFIHGDHCSAVLDLCEAVPRIILTCVSSGQVGWLGCPRHVPACVEGGIGPLSLGRTGLFGYAGNLVGKIVCAGMKNQLVTQLASKPTCRSCRCSQSFHQLLRGQGHFGTGRSSRRTAGG